MAHIVSVVHHQAMLDATYYLQPNYNVGYWVNKSLKTRGIPMSQEELEATNLTIMMVRNLTLLKWKH
jgi:hypothetical protein